MPENNIKQIVRFVRNAAIVLISAYFLNRLIWIYITTQAKAGNYGAVNIFVRFLGMFPERPMERWTAWDTPTLLWGYFLTVIFVTLLALLIQKLRGK